MTFVIAGVISLVFAGLGIYALHVARLEGRQLGKGRSAPVSPLGAKREGRMEAAGSVEAEGVFEAPMTGRRAVQCTWFVEYEGPDGRGERASGALGSEIFVRTPEGRARVLLEGARIEHGPAGHASGTIEGTPPEALESLSSFLADQELEVERLVRWTELCVQPGDPLYAVGPARTELVGGEPLTVFRSGGPDELLVSNATRQAVAASLGLNRRTAMGMGVVSITISVLVLVSALLLFL